MANNVRATLYVDERARDELGQLVGEMTPWREVWCEATYSGGSRRTYAGRLVSEHQVVLTTWWREGIEQVSFVALADGKLHEVIDVVPEGRRHKVHIIYLNDERSYGE